MVLPFTAILFALLLAVAPARAVILAATGDPTRNTTAPGGALTNSGWQLQGQWGSFLGTPIAPTFFLAAQHVGGSTGQVFTLNGYDYHAIASADCPNSDLRVWQVAETFPQYAPLFTSTNEVGQSVVVIGRGTQRGAEVVVSGQTNGWLWGAGDGVMRWGQNTVTAIESDPNLGDFLRCAFDRTAPTTNECHLSSGDSSGAVFISDGGVWKLAGINYAVDGPFSTNSSGSNAFQAALLDMRGLYVSDGGWTLVPLHPPPAKPSSFYASRVSAHLGWLQTNINFSTGPDLRITGVVRSGNDLQVTLATAANRLYRLDTSTNLTAAVWTTVTNNLPGTGSSIGVTDPGAALGPQRFYRVRLNP